MTLQVTRGQHEETETPLLAERRSGGTCPRGEHPCRRSDPGQEATSSAGRRDPQGTALSSSEGTAASLPRWDAHVLLGGWTGELPSALRPPCERGVFLGGTRRGEWLWENGVPPPAS